MRPSLPGGVKFTIDIYPSTIEEGDIVTYYILDGAELSITQHRVIDINNGTITVKGEGITAKPEEINRNNIISKTLAYKQKPFYIPVSPIAIRETIRRFK